MYSNEKKKIAVETYIKNGLRTAPTIRELGYPDRKVIKVWYKIYTENNSSFPNKKRKPRYTKEQRKKAVEHYLNTGRCISYTTRCLGYPSRTILSKWLQEDVPDFKKACLTGKSKVSYTKQKKKEILQDIVIGKKTITSLAKDHNITPVSIYNWKNEVLSKESLAMIQDNKKKKSNTDIKILQDELSTLQKEVAKLQLEKDILETAVKVLKKAEGIDFITISNIEKTIIINALKDTYKIKELLVRLNISSSSYFYCANRLKKEDKYKEIRTIIHDIFSQSYQAYGYRRIHGELSNKKISISEKVVRKIMKEESLTVYNKKKKKYSSYLGEISPAVENLVNRNFHCNEPNKLLLTDITEFSIPAGKVYLSPLVDCYDGLVTSWSISSSPNAQLVNSMLETALDSFSNDNSVIIHSDRGAHYRWPQWIEIMDNNKLIRSMSKKGCSPDNSACEGFFGRLKNEMFYNKDWTSISIDKFIEEVDIYIKWYNEKRIKKSLGWLSPIDYRRAKGVL